MVFAEITVFQLFVFLIIFLFIYFGFHKQIPIILILGGFALSVASYQFFTSWALIFFLFLGIMIIFGNVWSVGAKSA